jgi:hypothetical protein
MTELIDLPGPPGLFATRGVQNFPTKRLSGGRPNKILSQDHAHARSCSRHYRVSEHASLNSANICACA